MKVPPRNIRFKNNPPTEPSAVDYASMSPAQPSPRTFKIACNCGRPVIVSEASLGTSHQCVCGHTLSIPSHDEIETKQMQGEVKLLTSEETSHLTPSHQSHQQDSVVVLGSLIIVVGLGLFLGNITGLFPTFPFAGYLTIGLGGLVLSAGRAGTFG
jgi:hypothetical protein